jgi:hypothetical protein
MQSVPGVVAVTLADFNYSKAAAGSDPPPDALTASAPTLGATGLLGAELLTLELGTLPDVVLA